MTGVEMDETTSNFRPLAIFSGYMVTAAALALTCIANIRPRRSRSEAPATIPVRVFTLLAVISLATTWYHMFSFFHWSYLQWKAAQPADAFDWDNGPFLGHWLRDTALFHQAWASTLETPARSWWSLQIFGFCANWSVVLAGQSKKRRIPHAWAFMALGQVVAISFASNLFFLAVLSRAVAYPPPPPEAGQKKPSSLSSRIRDILFAPAFWYPTVLGVTIGWALKLPTNFGTPGFLRLLLVPHALVFVPVVLNAFITDRVPVYSLDQPAWPMRAALVGGLVAVASKRVFDAGIDVQGLLATLHEHPAVSSVGWDVICCWISFGAWALLGEA